MASGTAAQRIGGFSEGGDAEAPTTSPRAPAVVSDAHKPVSAAGGSGGGLASSAPISKEGNSYATALPAISFWIFMSCSVILFNKALYVGPFPHPLTLTMIHMTFATVATTVLRLTGRLHVPQLGWEFWTRNVLPIGVLYAGSLGFSNIAAIHLSVSFIQMVKAITPFITLAISIAMRMEEPSRALAVVVTLMCVGVGIASYGEILFDSWGLTAQLISITTEAARLVVTQKLVQAQLPKGASPLVSVSLFAPASLAFLAPIALYKEPGALTKLLSAGTGLTVLANTGTAFMLNVAVVILVQQTSGLTLTLAGIIKDILLIVVSIWLFGNPITTVQVVGYTLALFGLQMYHEFRAAKDPADKQLGPLIRRALHSRAMHGALVGMVILFFVASSSTPSAQAQRGH